MHDTHDKLTAALQYLRDRNMYILDKEGSFTYRPSHKTDVRRRIEDVRIMRRAQEIRLDLFDLCEPF
jgi:hypothetical protein